MLKTIRVVSKLVIVVAVVFLTVMLKTIRVVSKLVIVVAVVSQTATLTQMGIPAFLFIGLKIAVSLIVILPHTVTEVYIFLVQKGYMFSTVISS